MRKEYKREIANIVKALETIQSVKAPVGEYLAALEAAKEEIYNWIESSIEAAKDDVRREEE